MGSKFADSLAFLNSEEHSWFLKSMLDAITLNKFIGAANKAHQQFCVWFSGQNQFAKHVERWNKIDSDIGPFPLEKFTRRHGSKYKNFWSVTTANVQHGWILGTARLFDPAYHLRDKNRERPRISFDYVLLGLNNQDLRESLRSQLEQHKKTIDSVKTHRDNWLAHNDANFNNTRIEAGIENLYEWIESAVDQIKKTEEGLSGCNIVNVKYNEILSKCGVDEVFETLLIGEENETDFR